MAFELELLREFARAGTDAATSAVATASRLLERSMERKRGGQLSSTYPDTLTRKLLEFASALNAFSWPDAEAPWHRARLVVEDPGMSEALSSELRWDADAVRTNRFFSKSFDAAAAHDLDAGSYSMTFSYGDKSAEATFSVDHEDRTWSDVLTKYTGAVNALDLPVQASIVFQTVPQEKVPGLMKTGTVVALAVDAAHEDELFIDSREFLPRALDLTAPIASSVGAPTLMAHHVTPYQRAIPSRFYSEIFDPNAGTSLSQGEHFFNYSNGTESGIVSVSVGSGDTWEDVLVKTANALNSAQDDFRAAVIGADRFEYVQAPGDQLRRLRATGVQLTLEGVQPKLGETITFGFGPAADSASAFHDPTSGLPPETAGTSYIATATANGWTAGNVYTHSTGPTTWVETVSVAGDARYVDGLLANYRYDGASWSVAQNFVTETGLNETAWPGQDGEITANGQIMTSASNTHALDDGHLLLNVEESAGAGLPLKVVQALDQVERSLVGVVNAYNGLTRFLEADAAQWRSGFRSQWGGPVEQRRSQLEWMGVRELTDKSLLWVDADRFFTALGENPDRAEQILWKGTGSGARGNGGSGLIPQWQAMVEKTLAAGAQSFFNNAPEPPKFPWRTGDLEEESVSILLDRKE